jgi:hypothetical protein
MSTYTIVMKLANNLTILLQSFPYVCPFPSCEFGTSFSRKKNPDQDYTAPEPEDRVINKCGAVGGMRTGRPNQSPWRKPASVPLVDQKSHMTRLGIKLGPTWWEASN